MTEEIHYKSAASKWFDEIPDDWHMSKLKFVVNIFTGNSLNDGEKLRFSSDENPELKGYNYISSKDIDVSTSMCNYDTGIIIPTSETKYKVAPSNSTLLCIEGGSAGRKITFTTEDVCFVNKLACFKSTETTHPKFVYYFLQSNEFKSQFQSSLSGLIGGVSLANLNDFEIPFPPIKYQSQIAAFLDRKTAQIDTIIEKKQKLLQLLDEKKKSVINEAVTKGLDRDVLMKDSGIEWIGQIPKNWKISKLKYVKSHAANSFVDGPFGSNLKSEHYVDNGDVYVIESGFITSGNFEFVREFKSITESHYKTIERSSCKEGDIIIAKIGANYGMSGILPKLDKPSVVSGNSLKLTVDTNSHSIEFINLYLLSLKETDFFKIIVNETAQPALSLGLLNEVEIPIPNKEEQIKIVSYIQEKIILIANILEKLKVQINKLQEYRQSLISEAVTGKIDVTKYN